MRATRGEFLFLGDEPVDTVYSSHSGGHTENNENVWNQAPSPALRGVQDGGEPVGDLHLEADVARYLDAPAQGYAWNTGYNQDKSRWRRTIDAAKLDARADDWYGTGKVTLIQALGRGASGRLTGIKLVGAKRSVVVWRELPIRRLFFDLPSALATITAVRDDQGRPVNWVVNGAGFGHGVGMCQTGAIGRAKAGQSYRDILGAYYGGAKVEKLY